MKHKLPRWLQMSIFRFQLNPMHHELTYISLLMIMFWLIYG